MIELRALGGLQLRDAAGGHEILSVLARGKPPSVLVYLALSPPNVSHVRDELLALLWPDSSTEKARNSLNQALHILRRGLGPGVIGTTEGGELFLEADAVWCDVAAFDEALAAGHAREALELYGGHLWDASDLSDDCPAFVRWLDEERRRLRLQAVGAAVTLAHELERDGSFVDAVQWLRQAGDWAPFDEAVIRPLLNLLRRMGEHGAAARECDEYEKRLGDVGMTPSIEMSELIERVRASTASPESAVPPVLPEVERTAQVGQQGQQAVASPPEDERVTIQPRSAWRTRGRAAAAIVVLGATVAVADTFMRNGRVDVQALDPTRVLVDIFQNETGDPLLDALGRMATDHVTAGLTYTSFVDVVSLGTQLLSLEPVGAGTNLSLEHDDLQALARANGTGTVVWGSYYLQGDSVYFLAHATNAATGEELATIEARGPVDEPVAAVERLRDGVMTALATHTDPRLATWMRNASRPPTLEAYAEFAEGIELRVNRKASPVPHFLRAAALDSDFTMALLWAAQTDVQTPDSIRTGVERADSIRQVLDGRRAQLAPLDRLFLDYQLALERRDSRGDRDLQGAVEALRRFVEIAPGSWLLLTAGNTALRANRPEEAIEFLAQADPESPRVRRRVGYWVDLTRAYHRAGNYEAELAAFDRMRHLHPEARQTKQVEFRTLAASGRIEELYALIPEEFQRSPTLSLFVNGNMFRASEELSAHGYPAAASDLTDRALEWFESRPSDWKPDPGQSYVYATLLNQVARWVEARVVLEDVLKAVPYPSPFQHNATLQLTYALASQGKRDEAFRALSIVHRPNDPGLLAWVEAALGERERAMELLRESRFEIDGHRRAWLGPLESMRDYPPFVEEFMTPKG